MIETVILGKGSSEDLLKSIITAIGLLISIFRSSFSLAQTVPVQELDLTHYAPGTHFSVIYDSKNPNRV